MADIVIKRKVSLEFLGEDYKESWLEFKVMSIKEYKEYVKDIEAIKDDEAKSVDSIMRVLKDHFVAGQFQGQAVEAANLDDFDPTSLANIFKQFAGESLDPKVEKPS